MNSSQLFFIGSLPFVSPFEAAKFVKRYSPHLPFLPQLPERSSQEDMVGQVLQGFETGGWTEDTCSSLGVFLNDFGKSSEVKVQVAGPLTVSRAMSTTYEEIWPKWFEFAKNLVRQMESKGLESRLWFQVDEPFWNQSVPLPEQYEMLLCSLRGMRKGTKVGLHTCAKERPDIQPRTLAFCDFVSLDYTQSPLTAEEAKSWEQVWALSNTHLVAGIIAPGKKADWSCISRLKETPRQSILYSAACGLGDWTAAQIEASFEGFA